MRKFTGIDFTKESVPDETTLCKFRHLLEDKCLNKLFFDGINRVMVQSGHMMKGGTIINAHDITQTAQLLREDNKVVCGDSGYLGIQNRPEIANDEHYSKIDFRINRRPGRLPHVSDSAIDWNNN